MTEKRTGTRNLIFALFFIFSAFIYSPYLLELIAFSRENELYSHILFIPVVSAYLMYSNRKKIFSQTSFSYMVFLPLMTSLAVFIAAQKTHLSENDFLSAMVLSWAVFVCGGFWAVYGTKAVHAAMFPVAFLLFMIPLPETALDSITRFLQSWSAKTAWQIFNIAGAPVQRDGYFFHLPGLTVEVAKQCSGIRSSMALFISGVLAAHLFLRTWPAKSALIAVVVPIAVLKNGLRIAALTLSGYYIDERMLYGSLHTNGGMLFFAIAAALAGAGIWFLRSIERKTLKKNAAGA
ncbi:MAG: exosortase/archaeosortase family protein [Deltaproteobacteria bacterium]|nr:exosortase/archaeosortase family protein [Deltaproteobacteria bacterium]